jgi:hypothetical protein
MSRPRHRMDRLGGCGPVTGGTAVLALHRLALAARALGAAGRNPRQGRRSRRWIRRIRRWSLVGAVASFLLLPRRGHPRPLPGRGPRRSAPARRTRDYQARTGAWTRDVGGRRVAFPYSPAFHVLAWPAALVLGGAGGEVRGRRRAGPDRAPRPCAGRSLGFGPRAALLAQALIVLLPVTASRLVLALFPTLWPGPRAPADRLPGAKRERAAAVGVEARACSSSCARRPTPDPC